MVVMFTIIASHFKGIALTIHLFVIEHEKLGFKIFSFIKIKWRV